MQPSTHTRSSSAPLLSVVIPTKNRSELTRIAITSVLRQTHDDWELVVADNSDDDATRDVVQMFDDPRVVYQRSGGLSMCENWEFAARHVRGDYMCLLEDKQALRYDALKVLAKLIEREEPQVVRWQSAALVRFGLGYRVRNAGGSGQVRTVSPDVPLDAIVNRSYMDAKNLLPIPHYSAVKRSLLDTIRKGPVGLLFPPVSPDYTLALQICNYAESITYVDDALVAFSDLSVSTGESFRRKTALSRQFTAEMGGPGIYYDEVPVKVGTIFGCIYNDYCRLHSIHTERLASFSPNWVNYFIGCYAAIQSSIAIGVDMSWEMEEWQRALDEVSPEAKREVRLLAASYDAKHGRMLRRVKKSAALSKCKQVMRSVILGKILRRPTWRYDNILSYFDWEAKQLG